MTRSRRRNLTSSKTGNGVRGRRIAVIGADGFIGSHLTRAALADGADVVAVCINDAWRLARCADIERVVIGGRWWGPEAIGVLSGLVKRSDAVVLLAYTPPSASPPPEPDHHERSTNVLGAARVLELASAYARPVVFASSADVYGAGQDAPLTENSGCVPLTPYARAKLEAEALVGQLAVTVPGSCSLRLGTVFGPGEHASRAIPTFIRAYLRDESPVLHGEGTDIRDYIHVRDVAQAFLAALAPPDGGERRSVFNVGSGTGRTTIEVMEAVATALHRAPRRRHIASPRPPTSITLDCGEAHRALGWSARESFGEGLAEEARWLRERDATSAAWATRSAATGSGEPARSPASASPNC